MDNNTYAVSQIVGTSPDSVAQAIKNGVSRANQTTRNLDWFEVKEIRGHIENGEVAHFQVTMNIGFRMDD